MELLKGEVHSACGFPGLIIPSEVINSVLVLTVEAEKRRVEADALWRSILSEEAEYLEKEAEKVAKGTPTPPRGRPKRLAVRIIVLTPPEEFLRGPAVTEPSPIDTEKEAEEMAVEAEESDEESPTEKNT
ncbi:hypothetical protein F2Q69_00020414 [Brassica cretica]|uniref:Uncharacterized protein n=1 Tax=Brassica cretica TaxID=69181 RepID=A0A8S9Q603_BRACR|nr:hypothetical protein F2Q69_00020414 [Brassica cretica]